ncbi:MAG TPA: GntR family transcriptional regulator [Candidatus Microbacterium pullistercoris]|nr:GntR family transcriptional regulator [Candidatus Microbacterium pullistercoris]
MANSLSTLTRRVVFAPLEGAGRTETVASRIRSAITLGIYADGEQLPNEIALAGQLSVSPVTLRDALRLIRDEGLVRTSRGRNGGTFVVSPRESNTALFEAALRAKSAIELRDLLDWQSAVMCHAAKFAAQRALDREVDAMRESLAPLIRNIDAITARRTYSRVLIEIAASGRSSRVNKTAIELQVEFAPLATLVFRDVKVRDSLFAAVERVLDAIAARDDRDAAEQMSNATALIAQRIQKIRHDLTHTRPEPEALTS